MALHAENGVDGSSGGILDFATFSNVIDGKLSSTSKTRHGINPATDKPNPEVPVSTPEDVDRAVAAAKKASKAWGKTSYADRRKAVLAFADALEKEKEGFAHMLTKEQGKPIGFAHFEMDFALSIIRTMAGLELPTEEIVDEESRKIIVRYTPLGTTVGIVPWNYPVLLCVSKIAPCVVTGNPIIIKPSPFTPYSGLKVVELAQQYFPPGVVQALSGDDSLGPWLTAHPGPAKISFTGSSATGKKVMESASKTLKRVTLELGGNDPAVVCDDVDIKEVAPKIATLAFLNSGQICLALKRIFVHEKIFDEFRDAMVEHTKTLKLGEGNEEGVFLGPIQNSMQYERVKGFFSDIEKEKWNVAIGGKNPDGPGYFITPTIIDRPKDDSRLVVEEPFGPIVPLLSFSTDEEAVTKANNTIYGLGASVWSADLDRATKIAEQLEAGNVWVNTHFELDPRAPFGGHKESGIGTEFGVGGLKSYCNSQTLYLKK
ncbi:NAD-dependent aldehyde dehydrogenase [Exophiala aquamarina CBS 119918]|uniref:aldehyde dehydrogenase (NAD(+)) n=1 Tax=Exophiala aquamarina CBS 119918 TaxID=1182545 RepID=A0A072Q3I3_9EURO|nr:NAD-dependent aldehyde dehydrogenase [Exophiala aquamarina CBS 119918]KEF62465.1 NAD-dependent aldehyde dehydrogenase [Exophiala aquamarina CBS 119918]